MKKRSNLGIWMDHATANMIDLNSNKYSRTIASKFTFETKEETLSRSENIMHNKEQQMHEAYYNEIAEEILKYEHVLLFGPTNAKVELHNHLGKDLHFDKIVIDIKSSDKITDNEKIAFVRNHFDEGMG